MSRRRHEQEDGGSDSFLDVLANLVGILVVLVVMTALQAAVVPAAPDAEPIETPAVAVTPPPAPEPVQPVRAPLIAPKPNVVYLPTPAPAIPAGLEREVASKESTLAALRRRLDEAKAAAEIAREAADAERSGVAAAIERLRRTRTAEEAERAKAELAARAAAAARLDRDLWAAKAAAAKDKPLERLEHSALPVGRRVSGDELHFRLTGDPNDPKGGLVRPVPIDALTERLERDVQGRRMAIVEAGGYDGTVGPMSGYLMNYRIEQEGRDVVSRVRTGGTQIIRFRLAGWTLADSGDDPSVPVATALKEGSDFRFLLATAGPGATATFWVAPEAFGAFRTLREAARTAGLRVAARPLPAGVPISGSPDGTRSVAQ
ncbi:hypothetical protein [Alienimonas chondri]|uniref:Uncharacterized protein n=1 Tax=Alienimonas chondri TaxID=2681879 RepID=A0ABX1V9U9_9PLAN|nr:hypothetical protein [Alienimonas chondri]NNJ24865.1 hypothetical protein [Alienimonas chondri]